MPLLYKYAASKAIGYILEGRNLCFTSIAELNDPFEAGMDLGTLVEKQLQETYKCAQAAISVYFGVEATPDHVRFYFAQLEKAGLTEEMWRSSVARLAWETARIKFSQFGILSLAIRADNLLLWSHYGDCCQSLAIGFDANAEPIADSTFAGSGIVGPEGVRYDEKRADNTAQDLAARLRAICLTKSPAWVDEEEMRCVRKVPKGEQRLCIAFDPVIVKEIILGPRTPIEHVKRCAELRDAIYPHAALLFAVPNPSHFAMDIHPAPPSKLLDCVLPAAVSAQPLRISEPTVQP